MPRFHRAAALHARSSGRPAATGWVPRDQVRRLPHAIARRGRRGRAEDPQGAGLDRQVPGHRQGSGSALPDCIIDGEIVALDHNGAPDFAALQAALSDGKTDNLIFFAFDLLFAEARICARCRSRERKARLKRLLEARPRAKPHRSAMSSISRPAAMRCCNRPASCRWKASSRRSSTRPIAPAAARAGPRPNAAPGMRWCIGGWSDHQRQIPLAAGRASIAAIIWSMSAGSAPASARTRSGASCRALKAAASDKSPFGGKDAPRKTRDVHWLKPELVAEIEFAGWTDDGNDAAGRVQGPARRTSRPTR